MGRPVGPNQRDLVDELGLPGGEAALGGLVPPAELVQLGDDPGAPRRPVERRHLAEAAHAGGARVWLYDLCWGFNALGASHSLDTLLVFGTAEIETGLPDAGPEVVAQSRRLSELMRAGHVAFAATGDPGWARYDPQERITRVYDAESGVGRYPEERSRRIWRDQRFDALDRTG